MKRSKRSRRLAAFTLIACAVACGHKTETVTRTVTLHVPLQCAPDPAGVAPYGFFVASGDFDPSFGVGRTLTDVGATLAGVPVATRSLVVDVAAGELEWRGVRDVPSSGDVDALVWPFLSPCALSAAVDRASGVGLGALDGARAIVVGGRATPPDPLPRAWVADLTTGTLVPMRDGLLTARAGATVSPFGDGALVAGGESAVDGTVLATAEVFVSNLHDVGDFDHQPIALSVARAEHGAARLATGETILVGGRGANGIALRSIEIVDPASRASRSQGLAQLEVARTNPTVLRLANGEILVAGGFDDQNLPIAKLEWLTPDARGVARNSRDLVARKRRAFVPLPAGGALAVIAPDAGDTSLVSVWVVSAGGDLEPAAPVGAPLGSVALFRGSEGRPMLWTGDRWLRWSPWRGELVDPNVTPAALPGLPLGPSGGATASPDDGLALFLTLDDTRVTGLRFAAPNAFASIVQPLLVGDASLLAPDRLVLPGSTKSIAFDPATGLSLTDGATAFVTDLAFGAFALDVDAPTGEPAIVVVRDERGVETEIGAVACPFAATPGAPQSIHVERRGASVTVGGRDCGRVRADARVSLGFRAPSSQRAVVRNVRVAR